MKKKKFIYFSHFNFQSILAKRDNYSEVLVSTCSIKGLVDSLYYEYYKKKRKKTLIEEWTPEMYFHYASCLIESIKKMSANLLHTIGAFSFEQ